MSVREGQGQFQPDFQKYLKLSAKIMLQTTPKTHKLLTNQSLPYITNIIHLQMYNKRIAMLHQQFLNNWEGSPNYYHEKDEIEIYKIYQNFSKWLTSSKAKKSMVC